MHTTELESGNVVNYNSDWSGSLRLARAPTLEDCAEILLHALADELLMVLKQNPRSHVVRGLAEDLEHVSDIIASL